MIRCVFMSKRPAAGRCDLHRAALLARRVRRGCPVIGQRVFTAEEVAGSAWAVLMIAAIMIAVVISFSYFIVLVMLLLGFFARPGPFARGHDFPTQGGGLRAVACRYTAAAIARSVPPVCLV